MGEEVEVVEALVGVDNKKGGVPETEPFVKARDAGQRVGARCGSIGVSLRREERERNKSSSTKEGEGERRRSWNERPW